jgi:uncharacterized protein YdiU (UPF0061 family)
MQPAADKSGLQQLLSHTSPSFVRDLRRDPDAGKHEPNRSSREVFSGHYVPVRPTPLPKPFLVTYSSDMAAELQLSKDDLESGAALLFFSGATEVADPVPVSWATPYALSIYGQELYHNCPFGTGNGYGDGRAISIAEVLAPSGRRWELQLKGGGRTPFCRSGDGRAVLRSSVREFLASEAMFHLGVPTTRALCLIASRSEKVARPWYPDPDTLRPGERRPEMLTVDLAAITTRVSPSFIRVGQVELYGRRAREEVMGGVRDGRATVELRLLLEHLLRREYGDEPTDSPVPNPQPRPAADASIAAKASWLAQAFSRRLAHLTAEWLRVGFCQGNFNSDNCLAGGRTMDYGPFGFIEKYDPRWNMWVGGGEHYSFMNQPDAGLRNFASFCGALLPLLDEGAREQLGALVEAHAVRAAEAVNEVWRRKLGLAVWGDGPDGPARLLAALLRLMQRTPADYTLTWRLLPAVLELPAPLQPASVLDVLRPAFYEQPDAAAADEWSRWVGKWRALVEGQAGGCAAAAAAMRAASPKYVPREWMLANAYKAAQRGDYGPLEELAALFRRPYDEQPEMEQRYFRRAEDCVFKGRGQGGLAFMS